MNRRDRIRALLALLSMAKCDAENIGREAKERRLDVYAIDFLEAAEESTYFCQRTKSPKRKDELR